MSTQEPGAWRVRHGGCVNVLCVSRQMSCALRQVRIGGAGAADPLNGAKAWQGLAQRCAQRFGAWKDVVVVGVDRNAHPLILRGEL